MSEEDIFRQLQESFDHAAQIHHLDPAGFRREELKEFSTVYYDKFLLFRVRSRGSGDYVDFKQGRMPLGEEWTKEMEASLLSAVENMVDNAGKEFDCCALYEACSDAGHCVQEYDRRRTLYCGYRKVLKSGRVFFGKNRNV